MVIFSGPRALLGLSIEPVCKRTFVRQPSGHARAGPGMEESQEEDMFLWDCKSSEPVPVPKARIVVQKVYQRSRCWSDVESHRVTFTKSIPCLVSGRCCCPAEHCWYWNLLLTEPCLSHQLCCPSGQEPLAFTTKGVKFITWSSHSFLGSAFSQYTSASF